MAAGKFYELRIFSCFMNYDYHNATNDLVFTNYKAQLNQSLTKLDSGVMTPRCF